MPPVITAVDTNVVLDIFGADHAFGPSSKDLLRRGIAEGQLIACEVVWAQVGAFFPTPMGRAERCNGWASSSAQCRSKHRWKPAGRGGITAAVAVPAAGWRQTF